MKNLILIALLILTNLGFTQNFAPVGSIWHFQDFCDTPTWFNDCGFYTIEAVRDTTINGNVCTILEKDKGGIVAGAQVIIWENNNKVYFYENNQFKLFVDFNLNAGDTLIYQIPQNFNHYNLVCSGGSDTSKFGYALIDSTQNITVNFQTLKILNTSQLDPNNTNYLAWDLGQITERIGGLEGLFSHPSIICLSGFSGHFRCYSDNLINYKPVSEDCDFVTGIDSYINKNLINIYPNPTFNNFTINGIEEPYNIMVFNSFGQLLLQETGIKGEKEIDVTAYSKGLLLINIEIEGEIYSQKIISQ